MFSCNQGQCKTDGQNCEVMSLNSYIEMTQERLHEWTRRKNESIQHLRKQVSDIVDHYR